MRKALELVLIAGLSLSPNLSSATEEAGVVGAAQANRQGAVTGQNLYPSSGGVPQTAELLFSESVPSSAGQSIDGMVRYLRSEISKKESSENIQLKCQALYYVWSTDSSVECYRGTGWGPGGCLNPFNQLFGSSQFVSVKSASVSVLCDPRPFDQQVIVSLYSKCTSTQPPKECFTQESQDILRRLRPTLRYDLLAK